jgi:transposase
MANSVKQSGIYINEESGKFASMKNICGETMPQARMVIDKFHTVKHLMEALQEEVCLSTNRQEYSWTNPRVERKSKTKRHEGIDASLQDD